MALPLNARNTIFLPSRSFTAVGGHEYSDGPDLLALLSSSAMNFTVEFISGRKIFVRIQNLHLHLDGRFLAIGLGRNFRDHTFLLAVRETRPP